LIFQSQLRIPGPTPIPERVIRAASQPMIDHRGPEFAELLAEVTAGAKQVFKTANDLLVLSSSGTGSMESAAANLLSRGDTVVVAIAGNFGERMASICTAFGAEIIRLESEWGEPIDPDDLTDVLAGHPEVRVVFLTHNETSTGMTNPLADLLRVVRDAGRISVVDGISSISSIPIEVDAWGADVALSASQKGWMSPPGLSFVSVSAEAWEQQSQASSSRFYFDWKSARDWAAKGATPYTPAVSLFYAVREGIRMLLEEELENVYTRHRRLADATAAGLEAAGFTLYAAPGYRSATVTAALVPAGCEVGPLRKLLRERYGVVIAEGRGQGRMTERLIRVGHLGAVTDGDVIQVLWAIEQALEELDVAPSEGKAVNAAGAVLGREAAPVS
jgi:aspartate aminotransferase-like enzyme